MQLGGPHQLMHILPPPCNMYTEKSAFVWGTVCLLPLNLSFEYMYLSLNQTFYDLYNYT